VKTRGFIDGEYQDGELRGMTLLAGMRGAGKTTEMDRLLQTCSGGVLFFDSLSKHAGVLKGYVVVHQPGELKAYLTRNHKKRFRILYQPRTGDFDAHFQAVCDIVKAFGWMIFGIDELDKCCGPRFGPSNMPRGLYELVNYGRHAIVSMLATARNPSRVSYDFVNECSYMRLFHMQNRYLKYFEQFIGTENVARMRSLQKFQYLLWRDGEEHAQICGGRRL